MEGTYHRRELLPPSVAFSSAEGRTLFKESLEEGYMELYFLLAEHYQTQSHPAFCGIASLAMALNTLLVDPGRVWQGVWRWYDESMLTSCESHEFMKQNGITLGKLACFARCNHAKVQLKYGCGVTVEQFRNDVRAVCSLQETEAEKKNRKVCRCTVRDPNHQLQQEQQPGHTATTTAAANDNQTISSCCSNDDNMEVTAVTRSGCCRMNNACCPSNNNEPLAPLVRVLIVSYSRAELSQTGTGHFSPIGGYHAATDKVLIMDVARFKLPPHWVPLTLLHAAMQPHDPAANKSRGYMILESTEKLQQACCCAPLPVGDTTNNSGDHCSNGSDCQCDCTPPAVMTAEIAPVSPRENTQQAHTEFCQHFDNENDYHYQDQLNALMAHSCEDCQGAGTCTGDYATTDENSGCDNK